MHRPEDRVRSAGFEGADHHVTWEGVRSTDQWLSTQETKDWKQSFEENGYLMVESLVNEEELKIYKDLYEKMLSGQIDASSHRHDLGNHVPRKDTRIENVTQIMWPSAIVPGLDHGPIHQRSLAVSRILLGADMEHDFDHLISKESGLGVSTAWHQDFAYWPKLTDMRATSCWVPLQDVDVDDGCMWFIPGSHKQELRPHRAVTDGVHILTFCEDAIGEREGVPVPLRAGGATFHHGGTAHYTRGNTGPRHRRAFITVHRPKAMVDYYRNTLNWDFGREVGIEGIKQTGQAHWNKPE